MKTQNNTWNLWLIYKYHVIRWLIVCHRSAMVVGGGRFDVYSYLSYVSVRVHLNIQQREKN